MTLDKFNFEITFDSCVCFVVLLLLDIANQSVTIKHVVIHSRRENLGQTAIHNGNFCSWRIDVCFAGNIITLYRLLAQNCRTCIPSCPLHFPILNIPHYPIVQFTQHLVSFPMDFNHQIHNSSSEHIPSSDLCLPFYYEQSQILRTAQTMI